MNRDLVTGIVGSIVLVGAMVGVFFYERNVAPIGDEGALALQTFDGPMATGKTDVGKSSQTLVNLTTLNMTNVTFTLTWKATSGKDTLKLTVAPPAGIPAGAESQPSDSGTLNVTVQVPNPKPGATPEQLGVGAWQVTVQFVKAEAGTPVPLPTTPPAGTDATVSWSVATKIEAWA